MSRLKRGTREPEPISLTEESAWYLMRMLAEPAWKGPNGERFKGVRVGIDNNDQGFLIASAQDAKVLLNLVENRGKRISSAPGRA